MAKISLGPGASMTAPPKGRAGSTAVCVGPAQAVGGGVTGPIITAARPGTIRDVASVPHSSEEGCTREDRSNSVEMESSLKQHGPWRLEDDRAAAEKVVDE